ncbi:MAG: V-type ATPase subunit [Sedimentisphaerales bacterium]|nr:V-type ATPase subunit [Sedimentisphaerales bacterium]
MITAISDMPVIDFYTYPAIGRDDWRYTFQTARVRALETQMLSGAILSDMAAAEDFSQAAELLSSSEYSLSAESKNTGRFENVLLAKRDAVRQLFAELMIDEEIVFLFKSRTDFVNLRLALRRLMTEKTLGTDYGSDGNFPAEEIEKAFESQEKEYIGEFALPEYMAEAAETAILAYYQNKDIRQIDYAIDVAQNNYNLTRAGQLKGEFLLALFRIQTDLTNIRTMLRVKFSELDVHNIFLEGGYVPAEVFEDSLHMELDVTEAGFFPTPYYDIVDRGSSYLKANKSFLKAEQQCEDYFYGFLRTTSQITAGPQPVIAYLLLKEAEIRKVRFILTARKHWIDKRLILDRIS